MSRSGLLFLSACATAAAALLSGCGGDSDGGEQGVQPLGLLFLSSSPVSTAGATATLVGQAASAQSLIVVEDGASTATTTAANRSFTVFDVVDQIVDSAVLIDDLRFVVGP